MVIRYFGRNSLKEGEFALYTNPQIEKDYDRVGDIGIVEKYIENYELILNPTVTLFLSPQGRRYKSVGRTPLPISDEKSDLTFYVGKKEIGRFLEKNGYEDDDITAVFEYLKKVKG